MPTIVPGTLGMSLINMSHCSFYYHVAGTITFLTYITSNPSNKSTSCLLLYLVHRGRNRGTEIEEASLLQKLIKGNQMAGTAPMEMAPGGMGPTPQHRLHTGFPKGPGLQVGLKGGSCTGSTEWLMESRGGSSKTRAVKS